MFLFAREIDQRLRWKAGTAERLAKQGKLPHFVLPNGEFRFEWAAVESAIVANRVEAGADR